MPNTPPDPPVRPNDLRQEVEEKIGDIEKRLADVERTLAERARRALEAQSREADTPAGPPPDDSGQTSD